MIDKNDKHSEQQKATEERILEAAETEFLQKGFSAARTTSIAEAAGVTHAMLHYYYRTKEKLFAKFIDNKLSALASTFIIDIKEESSLSECVSQAVRNHFEFVSANPLLPRFLISEVFANENLMELLIEKLRIVASPAILQLQRKIDEGVEKRECQPIDAITLLLDIVSLNVFPILAAPMICTIKNLNTPVEFEKFLESRKEENLIIILSRLHI